MLTGVLEVLLRAGRVRVVKDRVESLCPSCLRRVAGRVLRRGSSVFLEKECPDHGPFRAMIERDAGFYEDARHCGERPPKSGRRRMVIFPTYRCNMECPLCYVPLRDVSLDLRPADVADILARHPCDAVFFAGGEPTVMENLAELIEAARSKGAAPSIVTNGLALDEGLLAKLVRSGLESVILSLNALDRRVLKAVDGRDVLDAKMRAVEVVTALRVPFSCAFSLAGGINDGEMEKVYDFTASRYPLARGFYVDNLPGIGRGVGGRRVFLSELVDRFGRMLGVSRKALVERAEAGKARLNVYSFSINAGSLIAARRGMAGERSRFLVRCLTGMTGVEIDLRETGHQDMVLSFSRISPVMPLWEFFIRQGGRPG